MTTELHELVMPEYGQIVTVREKYRRRQRKHDGMGTWKYWEKIPFEAGNCVFLGTRILQNGVRDYEYDEGYYFDPHERFSAALVSPGPRRNPIYVPLESIEA